MTTPRRRTRKIAVVTGTRAEYGLLETVMRAVDAHPKLQLQCVAAGMHLVAHTLGDIAFPVAAKVRMQKPNQVGRHHDAVALGRGVGGFAQAFDQLQPDVVAVLGDRIEAFAAASAAAVAGFHVAHLHGGDRAEGVADESMRHAISKLAHLHFPATSASKRRLIRMGEHPQVIFNHGSPAVDGLSAVVPAEDAPRLIVMQHPVGDADAVEQKRMAATLRAAGKSNVLVMMPNHDPGRAGIVQAIHDAGIEATQHLPRPAFLAKLAGARAIVGNSSAGLIEAAVLKTPCVNIGTRQAGREKPNNVVDCGEGQNAIRAAIQSALALTRSRIRQPYGQGDTGQQIADTLAGLALQNIPLHKRNAY